MGVERKTDQLGSDAGRRPKAPLTAAELYQHPEFDTVIWDLKPSSKGKVAVGKDRQSTCQIAYETHGNGPLHLVVRLSRCSSDSIQAFQNIVEGSFPSKIRNSSATSFPPQGCRKSRLTSRISIDILCHKVNPLITSQHHVLSLVFVFNGAIEARQLLDDTKNATVDYGPGLLQISLATANQRLWS